MSTRAPSKWNILKKFVKQGNGSCERLSPLDFALDSGRDCSERKIRTGRSVPRLRPLSGAAAFDPRPVGREMQLRQGSRFLTSLEEPEFATRQTERVSTQMSNGTYVGGIYAGAELVHDHEGLEVALSGEQVQNGVAVRGAFSLNLFFRFVSEQLFGNAERSNRREIERIAEDEIVMRSNRRHATR